MSQKPGRLALKKEIAILSDEIAALEGALHTTQTRARRVIGYTCTALGGCKYPICECGVLDENISPTT